jgi:high-affinity Fe2+/Pb2+ permease
MGITYLTDGNFLRAGVGALVIALVLFLFFIGAQYMKGTDRKFARSIKWERFLLGVSPAIFIVVMIPLFPFLDGICQ